ncbi:Zinc finger MIZ domain-containing protein 1 [Schistosoma japonicum]|nr:Zinc finger MIZ domain-containing protein 1 [Schistosoma japonicum]
MSNVIIETSSGVGRGSRINSKKNLTSSTIPSVPSTESFSPSQRAINQQPRKPQSWNNGSAGNVNFNSTMISPTQSMGMPMLNSGFISGIDNRESPVTFATQSNSANIRPNSGPPANNSNISTSGILYNESSNSLDVQSNPNMRLPVSPRHSYCSSQMPMQQQYPIPNTSGNSCTYTSGHGNNVFYNQVNQHVLNINTPQQTLTSNSNQMCYPNNGPLNNNSSTQRTPPSAVQYQSHTLQPNSHIQNITSPMTSNCNRISAQPNPNSQNYPSPIPPAAGAYTLGLAKHEHHFNDI